MAKNETIRRYFHEIELLRRRGYPDLKYISRYLENFEIFKSPRTIERDIQELRENYGIAIVYDTQDKGYFIDEDKSVKFNAFMKFLETTHTAQIMMDGLTKSKDFLENIDFDISEGAKGVELLKPLLLAVNKSLVINFKHYSFYSKDEKTVVLKPYFLKEYQGRWYVIGFNDDYKEFRTYGLDRISNLELTKKKFKKKKEREIRERFDAIIGLVYSFNERQFVVLSFTPFQGRYIKSLPLHHSQEILIDNDKELRIQLFIIPNIELEQQILKYVPAVEVIKPEWLRKEIKNKLKNALAKYK